MQLTAQFSEKINGSLKIIAEGERKQFDESMTVQIEKTLGIDFEKLKIASIVQQGELDTIIKSKTKRIQRIIECNNWYR